MKEEKKMYSRRFTNAEKGLPSNYGGVAFSQAEHDEGALRRGREEGREDREDGRYVTENAAAPPGKDSPEDGAFASPRDRPGAANYMRRPSYAPRGVYEKREDPPERNRRPGLFSGGLQSISAEDIILAGILLLLAADGNGKREADNETLFILALLLFGRR